ncbi:hypothetical protein OJAV_G00033450 [Oryzias javanicus]|uniref:DUF5581 domain-containing protein n=1 Tax=Oryzias javanicus TaxID=123683 RepID=A0A437DFN0_ORYJA|nr:hypothetical protein OJAV_G00033450 [Oryzias javanicus]
MTPVLVFHHDGRKRSVQGLQIKSKTRNGRTGQTERKPREETAKKMTSSGFPTHDLTSPSTEEDTVAHITSLPNPMDQIWRLLNTELNHSAFAVMQEKLLLKQRSSYFYTIQNDNVRALEDQQESTSSPIDMLVSHLGPHRFQRVESWLTSQVVIFLTYLEMLLQEITISRQYLEAFTAKRMQVGVNADEVVSAEQQLKQIQEHMSNFEARMGKIIEPLTLNSLFLLEMRRSLLPSSRLQM